VEQADSAVQEYRASHSQFSAFLLDDVKNREFIDNW